MQSVECRMAEHKEKLITRKRDALARISELRKPQNREIAKDGAESAEDRRLEYDRLRTLERLNNELVLIQRALQRIEECTYGICADCGEPISEARMSALIYATQCITCKEKKPETPLSAVVRENRVRTSPYTYRRQSIAARNYYRRV